MGLDLFEVCCYVMIWIDRFCFLLRGTGVIMLRTEDHVKYEDGIAGISLWWCYTLRVTCKSKNKLCILNTISSFIYREEQIPYILGKWFTGLVGLRKEQLEPRGVLKAKETFTQLSSRTRAGKHIHCKIMSTISALLKSKSKVKSNISNNQNDVSLHSLRQINNIKCFDKSKQHVRTI